MILSPGDPGKFYPDQDSVDNDEPIACRIVDIVIGAPNTATLVYSDFGGDVIVGPGTGNYQATSDVTPVPEFLEGIPAAYSVTPTAIDSNQNSNIVASQGSAISAAITASVANLIARGNNIPQDLSRGDSVDGWEYDSSNAQWSRRFANDEVFFTYPVSANLATVAVGLRDDADVINGKMTVALAWWPQTLTPPKAITFENSLQSDGSGTYQNIIVPVTSQPTGNSLMRVRVTTGVAIAPGPSPYMIDQIYWTVTP